jgi:hypothetical protein
VDGGCGRHVHVRVNCRLGVPGQRLLRCDPPKQRYLEVSILNTSIRRREGASIKMVKQSVARREGVG